MVNDAISVVFAEQAEVVDLSLIPHVQHVEPVKNFFVWACIIQT